MVSSPDPQRSAAGSAWGRLSLFDVRRPARVSASSLPGCGAFRPAPPGGVVQERLLTVTDTVFTFSVEMLDSAANREFCRPPDQTLLTLAADEPVSHLIVADSFRSYLAPVPRRRPISLVEPLTVGGRASTRIPARALESRSASTRTRSATRNVVAMQAAAQSPERLDQATTNLHIAERRHLAIQLRFAPDGQRSVTSVREVVDADGLQVASNEIFRPGPDGHMFDRMCKLLLLSGEGGLPLTEE